MVHELNAKYRGGSCILSIDVKNAFNSPSRNDLARAIYGLATLKPFHRFFHAEYSSESELLYYGTHRGDQVKGEDKIGILAYADDLTIWSDSASELQEVLENVSSTTSHWGMQMNCGKTKCQVIQLFDSKTYHTVDIFLNGVGIEQVSSFKYLGSYIQEDTSLEKEVNNRIRSAFNALQVSKAVWKNKALSRWPKAKVFEAYVVPHLIYGCSIWQLAPMQFTRITQAYVQLIQQAFQIRTWEGETETNKMFTPSKEPTANQNFHGKSHEEILRIAHVPPLQVRIDVRILSFSGHVARMGPERFPNRILFGSYEGRIPRAGYKTADQAIRGSTERAGLNPIIWKTQAQNGKAWKDKIIKIYNIKKRIDTAINEGNEKSLFPQVIRHKVNIAVITRSGASPS